MPDISPSFVNPDYATPEQLAQLRAYSNALLYGKGQQEVHRPLQGVSNIVNALVGGYEGYKADKLQNEALQRAASRNSAVIEALLNRSGGGSASPLPAPPQVPISSTGVVPQPRAEVPSTPKVWGDKEATTAGIYPSGSGGVAPSPAQPPVSAPPPQPGAAPFAPPPGTTNNFAQRFGGMQADPRMIAHLVGSTMADPLVPQEQKQFVQSLIAPVSGADVYGQPTIASPLTGVNRQAVGPGVQPGIVKPITVTGEGGVSGTQVITPQGSEVPGIGGGASGIGGLAAVGRTLGAEAARTREGAKAEGEVIQRDITRAAAAPETLKGLGIMRNTIQSLGDSMTFGPTAKFSNEFRRVISNYAPSLVDEKALAGADAIEKLNLGLAGNLSQQLGLNPSDIYRSVASVPGNEKSKAGTLALINMMEQAAHNDQYVGTTLYNQFRGNLAGYQQARADFYAGHPIINPITNHPIQIDAESAGKTQQPSTPSGGWGIQRRAAQ